MTKIVMCPRDYYDVCRKGCELGCPCTLWAWDEDQIPSTDMLRLGNGESVKIVAVFTILRKGWEMDNTGWLSEDGRAFGTSHAGMPREMSIETVQDHIEETAASLAGLLYAQRAMLARLGTEGETTS